MSPLCAIDDADLPDLAARQLVVGVIARLSRQVERDRQPRLALFEVLAVERVRLARGGMACVGTHDPRPVRLVEAVAHPLNCMVRPPFGPSDRRQAPRPREGHLRLRGRWIRGRSGADDLARRAARRARWGAAAGASAHAHPPRPRGWDRRARPPLPRPARCTCTSAGRRTWWTRRSCSQAQSGYTATRWTPSGESSLPCPSATSRALRGGERVRGLARRVHARSRCAPRDLPARGDRRCVRR